MSELDDLKKRLYKKDESFSGRLREPGLTPFTDKAETFWRDKKEEPEIKRPKRSFFSWPTLLVIIVLMILGGFGAYYYLSSQGDATADKIAIDINAPKNMEGGGRITWDISITNNNKKSLEGAELGFEYPEGARPLEESNSGLRVRKTIGHINPNETVKLTFDAFLFGEKDEIKEARMSMEFRSQDSNAILTKDSNFQTVISASPVGIAFEIPAQLQNGQDVQFKVNYVSLAKDTIGDMTLQMEYPFGFEYKNAIPNSPDAGKTWEIKGLKPNDHGTIVINGTISGEDLEDKSFKAKIGVARGTSLDIYGGGVATIRIRRPFLDVRLVVNGAKKVSAPPGEIMEAQISYKNNLPVPVEDSIISLQFIGSGLDETKIHPLNGTYVAGTRSVVWNSSSAFELKKLDPGAGGQFSVQFVFTDPVKVRTAADKNLALDIKASMKPGIIPQGFAGTDLTGIDQASVKLATVLQVARRGYYNSTIIKNTGPMPPKVGVETTFTITWSLTNSTNDLDGMEVRASTPPYMKWKGVLSPAGVNISYNEASGEIIWKVGLLKAGIGYLKPAMQASFKVGFVPGIDQAGQVPDLVSRVSVSGHDSFVDKIISAEALSTTLSLPDDTMLTSSQRRVSQ